MTYILIDRHAQIVYTLLIAVNNIIVCLLIVCLCCLVYIIIVGFNVYFDVKLSIFRPKQFLGW